MGHHPMRKSELLIDSTLASDALLTCVVSGVTERISV